MTRRTTPSVAFRIGATAAICSVLGLMLAGLALILLFERHVERKFDEAMEDDVIHVASSLERRTDGRFRLRTPLETPLYDRMGSGWAWQARLGEDVVLGQSGSLAPGVVISAPTAAPGYFVLPDGAPVRGVSRPVRLEGLDAAVMLHVAGARDGIDADVGAYRDIAAAALAVLAVALVLAMLIQVRFGLHPLRRLAADVRRMRQGVGMPADGIWPAEVAPVVAELRGLQEHNAALIERGQRQAADLAHTLKTPLAVAYSIAEDTPDPLRAEMMAQLQRMDAAIKRNLVRTRSGPERGRRTDVGPLVDGLMIALDRIISDRGLTVTNYIDGAVFYGAPEDLEEMLGNLLENAAKWADKHIEARVTPCEEGVAIEISDDGPGVPPELHATVLGRGQRLDEATPGQGMGCSIVMEIGELYGGKLELGVAALGGLLARLILPGETIGPA